MRSIPILGLSIESFHFLVVVSLTDSETCRHYVISDLWWDEQRQDFLGCRSPVDGLAMDSEDISTPYLFDYFLRELNGHPVTYHPSRGQQQSQINDAFRTAAAESVDKWLGAGVLQHSEVFYLPDEFGIPHMYRRFLDEAVKQEYYQLIIPDDPSGEVVRHHLLFQYHSGGGGHLKMHKMYTEFQKRFWKGMYSDVARYAQSCDVCQIRGTTKDRREGVTPIRRWAEVSMPFQRVIIDY